MNGSLQKRRHHITHQQKRPDPKVWPFLISYHERFFIYGRRGRREKTFSFHG
jgi:hypothetical protein